MSSASESGFTPFGAEGELSVTIEETTGSEKITAHDEDALGLVGEKRSEQREQSCLVQIYPADVVDGMMLLSEDTLLIGRDRSADLALSDSSVSRKHALIEGTADGYRIRDLDSTNGTFVDGVLVNDVPLKSGDTIRVGSFLFKFLSAGSVESKYHETVYSALTHDALTGTFNKRYLLETLDRSLITAKRRKYPVTVVMADIDHFKHVNDNFGHLVGDEVLREFGQRIEVNCREDDLLARFGGEEFCLLLSMTHAQEAFQMAERCRVRIGERPFQTTAGDLSVTASFGFATLDPEEPESGNDLIRRADESLYEAKRTGRNRVCG